MVTVYFDKKLAIPVRGVGYRKWKNYAIQCPHCSHWVNIGNMKTLKDYPDQEHWCSNCDKVFLVMFEGPLELAAKRYR